MFAKTFSCQTNFSIKINTKISQAKLKQKKLTERFDEETPKNVIWTGICKEIKTCLRSNYNDLEVRIVGDMTSF